MRKHPSDDLIEAARQQMALRADLAPMNQDYESLSLRFRAESRFHSYSLSQQMFELAEPGGLLPLAPPTVRGAIGIFFIRRQAKVLWWLVRALQLRDRALGASYHLLQYHEERHAEMETRLAALESRLRVIEGKSDVS
jgi:hypothetical protein